MKYAFANMRCSTSPACAAPLGVEVDRVSGRMVLGGMVSGGIVIGIIREEARP
jgi:hypothetical protein